MKIKNLKVFSVCFFLTVFLFTGGLTISCNKDSEKNEQSGREQDDIVFIGDENLDTEVKDRLVSEIHKDNKSLTQYFEKGGDAIRKIGEFYGESGVLTTHDGEIIHGAEAITSYFTTLRSEDVKDLVFKTKLVYVKTLMHIKNKPKHLQNDNDVVDVFFEIISTNYYLNGEYIDPVSSTTRRHVQICDLIK